MPEGHTIHRLAADLRADLAGAPVTTDARQDRFADGARRLDGRVLEATSANGKHLFLHFSPGPAEADAGDEVLHIHLGLFGKFRRHPVPAPEPSPALRIRLGGNERAWDLTGAITCDLRDPGVLDEVAAGLGPDPLRADADPQRFVDAVLRSRRSIGALLLDQSVIAGIGNVYRAEVLFLTGIHPSREGRTLSEAEAKAVWDVTVEQLRLGVRRNRIVTVPLDGRWARSIRRADAVFAYKRPECKVCGSSIDWFALGGRTTYACPVCQPA